MTAKKSPNCKTQAARIDAREIGLITIKGQALVLTDLASYHFVVHGTTCNGIHAIAALNHGRASARRMASQLLNGKLPRKITATNAATIAWMELRAEAYSDAQSARPTLYRYIDGVELRRATRADLAASVEAARHDGGTGVFTAIVRGEKVDCWATA